MLDLHGHLQKVVVNKVVPEFSKLVTNWYICRRKDGQDAKKELPKRNLRDELEERERRHFSSKDKSYIGRKKRQPPSIGRGKGDVEDHLIPCSVDADDANVELKNDDGRRHDNEDDEDDTEALLLELKQIKKERAEEKLHNRWDDDVVFKNQARGESKAPKRFINDTIKNDFHWKFLHKYMK
ncbi:unnamed protein product [Camellia sinensis]